ncbi:hypothetical protein GCK72_011084 [Caenorhabditis remanei]|uniref:Uncharacterized protein n=2 Tax=Caenorhabditis remanei TaxID=31234 RepID=A0A6A5H7G6_CAERE|nr:hypothetical protein GCK72_011084 [Caenorhabditis remanei]KAF1762821.1 hypothetical protein GCK72_011084 [Caenorhabditis remanei]
MSTITSISQLDQYSQAILDRLKLEAERRPIRVLLLAPIWDDLISNTIGESAGEQLRFQVEPVLSTIKGLTRKQRCIICFIGGCRVNMERLLAACEFEASVDSKHRLTGITFDVVRYTGTHSRESKFMNPLQRQKKEAEGAARAARKERVDQMRDVLAATFFDLLALTFLLTQ